MRSSTSYSDNSMSSLCPTPTSLDSPPSTPVRSIYKRSGIGGAGNYHKPTSLALADTPSTPLLPPYPFRTHGSFSSGIGGAGNIHHTSERSRIDFEEELARGRIVERNAPVTYFCGIGGAGNHVLRRKHSPVLDQDGKGNVYSVMSAQPLEGNMRMDLLDAEHGHTYSSEPLPYGALDVLRKRLGQTFRQCRDVMGRQEDKESGREEERRLLHSHRSLWRF